jgi:hypothetical protein
VDEEDDDMTTAATLQAPIERYLRAVNSGDAGEFSSSFGEDALVVDVNREIRGLEAIGQWARTDIYAVNVHLDVLKVTEREGRTVVTVRIDGTFDRTGLPNPLVMNQAFTLADGKDLRAEDLVRVVKVNQASPGRRRRGVPRAATQPARLRSGS